MIYVYVECLYVCLSFLINKRISLGAKQTSCSSQTLFPAFRIKYLMVLHIQSSELWLYDEVIVFKEKH